MTNDELVSSLRQLADFYEAHPELVVPYFGYGDMLSIFPTSDIKRTFADYARAFGTAEKHADEQFFNLRKKVGSITLEVAARREAVCTRRVVATKVVPATIVPAKEVPEHIEEVVEWDCPESLLAESTEVSS